ncbi:hypothetical protein V1511DRAFT_508056 [Dipodascopsis uninucleata]
MSSLSLSRVAAISKVQLAQSAGNLNLESTIETLKKCLQIDPNDQEALGALVAALSFTDKETALSNSSLLPSIAELTSGIDIEELEAKGVRA